MLTALTAARSAEQLSYWEPGDWPQLAVELLVAGFDDAEIAELAGLPASIMGWDIDPLVVSLFECYRVPVLGAEDAVAFLARLMATDLRARPATVTAPMIRLMARLTRPAGESEMPWQCYGGEEYLDCDCGTSVDPEFEEELERLPSLPLPDGLVRILSRPLRATLPLVQPPHGH